LKINGSVCLVGNKNPYHYLIKALRQIKHRAWGGYLIDTGENFLSESDDFDTVKNIDTNTLAGYCISGRNNDNVQFPIHGSIYDEDENIQSRLEHARTYPSRLAKILRNIDGDYSFALLDGEKIIFGRDPLGVKPLFIGKKPGLLGVASEEKALKAIGLIGKSVLPGYVYSARFNKIERFPIKRIEQPANYCTDLSEAATNILELVEKSIERRLKGRKAAIGFSGGIDSSLLALLSSRINRVKLVSVFTPGSKDENAAKSAAKLLGLDLVEVSLDQKNIGQMIQHVSSLIESSSPMQVAIGLSVYTAAFSARCEGCDALILGQFADELFGGYQKYFKVYRDRGEKEVQDLMLNDINMAYQNNFERDEIVSSVFSELLLPYASIQIAEYAISIHPKLKINLEKNQRKIVLRVAAEKAGMHETLFTKPKKALQYSSKLQKLVSQIYKKSSLS
jgi:asparagine synthase (glutamine-hydrolysing)